MIWKLFFVLMLGFVFFDSRDDFSEWSLVEKVAFFFWTLALSALTIAGFIQLYKGG